MKIRLVQQMSTKICFHWLTKEASCSQITIGFSKMHSVVQFPTRSCLSEFSVAIIEWFKFSFFFFGAGDRTQGLAPARQAHYH